MLICRSISIWEFLGLKMPRRKKNPEAVPSSPEGGNQAPIAKKEEILVQTTLVAPSAELLTEILKSATDWAKECGLREPFNLSGPTKIDYPQRGYGFNVVIQEAGDAKRLGTARFTAEGKRSLWTRDGTVGA